MPDYTFCQNAHANIKYQCACALGPARLIYPVQCTYTCTCLGKTCLKIHSGTVHPTPYFLDIKTIMLTSLNLGSFNFQAVLMRF